MVSSKQAKAVNCDVLVVGAGLVGLAAVIALAEQGKRVVLIDTQNSEVVQKWHSHSKIGMHAFMH